jgi:ribosome-binding factor A
MRRDPVAGRKLLQLCGQVREALISILPGCGDEVLRDVQVCSVEAAPNAGQLRATVTVPGDGPDADIVRQRLKKAAGMLRWEVAGAIHRKHAPELAFEVL